ncbi:MAG: hypothetical protein NWE91_03980 [Candidatus Bathyarchaeota archaeon]|nr:hypothetical protein [Candidatus Bathyarchaeota archaeon]
MTSKLGSLDRCGLIMLRAKAFRRRVWFKTLSGMERGLINSVIKVVDKVRSTLLAKVLTSIVKKLLTALESHVARMMREVGRPLAKKISLIAQSWGNKSAREWMSNKEFIQFLAVTMMNTPSSFRV